MYKLIQEQAANILKSMLKNRNENRIRYFDEPMAMIKKVLEREKRRFICLG